MSMVNTAERVSTSASDNFVFQRCLFAYTESSSEVSGKVLEIGTGVGYGIEYIAPLVSEFHTIDKYKDPIIDTPELQGKASFEFIQMTIPPLKGIADNTYDYVISFQVIEHIEDDDAYLKEIHRVLRAGGRFICTTPNIKTSLSRNPWHVREYTKDQLQHKMQALFSDVITKGVYGNDKVMEYYESNKASVQKIMRFDIFDLQHKLPRKLLQVPFDLLNRLNRKKLMSQNTGLVSTLTTDDFYLQQVDDQCLDFYYIGIK